MVVSPPTGYWWAGLFYLVGYLPYHTIVIWLFWARRKTHPIAGVCTISRHNQWTGNRIIEITSIIVLGLMSDLLRDIIIIALPTTGVAAVAMYVTIVYHGGFDVGDAGLSMLLGTQQKHIQFIPLLMHPQQLFIMCASHDHPYIIIDGRL